ncbi:MAG: aldo/keto reductase [Planctomycetes bacterium]|jgi:predicted aldo/keto reductase-like oxidoreductase|nr:aldo/keto reductase [Planctomycetota bacterium]
MLYRTYGKTKNVVSAIGFGGMRFEEGTPEEMAELVQFAYDSGITYFDTAPLYCNNQSEHYFGLAFAEMKKSKGERFFVSTKSSGKTEKKIRKDLENSLQRMGLEYIDFYHAWCVMDWEDYCKRKSSGVFKTMEKLKEEGLIRHICVSTHMNGKEIGNMLKEYPFDGVLIGYSAMNFSYREVALDVAKDLQCGVAIMNPLGGGLIPQHPDVFSFVKTQEKESVVEAALRFLLDDSRITLMLVGFSNKAQIQEAIAAVDGYHPISESNRTRIRSNLHETFNSMCTGCQYCNLCPQHIEIPKFMDAYNQYLLTSKTKDLVKRLTWHWGNYKDALQLNSCLQCGACERNCTQKLPIIQRLQEVYHIVQKDADTNTKK